MLALFSGWLASLLTWLAGWLTGLPALLGLRIMLGSLVRLAGWLAYCEAAWLN